jgi:hypothetical protein
MAPWAVSLARRSNSGAAAGRLANTYKGVQFARQWLTTEHFSLIITDSHGDLWTEGH